MGKKINTLISATFVAVSLTSSMTMSYSYNTPLVAQAATKTGKVTGIKAGSTLNVRQSASSSAAVVGKLKNGTTVTITGSKGTWYSISAGSIKGWVSKSFIEETKSSSTSGIVNFSPAKDGTVKLANPKAKLTLYTSTSSKSKAKGTLNNATKVKVSQQKGSWYFITSGKLSGWVAKKDITLSSTSAKPQQGYVNKTKGDGYMHVYSKASTKSPLAGKLGTRTPILVQQKSGSWVYIAANGIKGWVAESHIAYGTPPVNPPVDEVFLFGNVSGASALNVRTEPNYSATIAATLNEAEQVDILAEQSVSTSNGTEIWYNISNNRTKGWVLSTYITKAIVPIDTVSKLAYVSAATGLNVRETPSYTASILGALPNESLLSITGETPEYYQIKYANGTGYVNKEYVSFAHTPRYRATAYDLPMVEYIQKQAKTTSITSNAYKTFENYINPSSAHNMMQFLRIDEYRNVDVNKINPLLKDRGVLSNRGQFFINSAKKFNIDPIYFIAQSIHETGWGKSTLANGVTISEIAKKGPDGKYIEIRNNKNELVAYQMEKLPQPVVVYNLYGIGAYDNTAAFPTRARILGTTRAYEEGWTSISRAIDGAAQFVSNNYAKSTKYYQNTVYKFRFNPLEKYRWHQYATTSWYAKEIGQLMVSFAPAYEPNNTFTYDLPSFANNGKMKLYNMALNTTEAETIAKLTLETDGSANLDAALQKAAENLATETN
ncbi:MAG: SH3 domain-containing protein [Bacilli bacterium]